jgi:hypothetical protein
MKAKARLYLARDMNCALAVVRAIQDIAGRGFENFSDFQSFMSKSEKCSDLIEFSSRLAVDIVERWK